MRSLPTLALGLLLAGFSFAAQAQKVAPGLWEAQMSMKSASGQLSEVDIRELNGWLDPNASVVSAPEKEVEPAPVITPAKKR